ncbi:MAG: AIR synthase-related protein [Planctomycetota bacterium]|nr:AIR synthase-related protein [Planctomycetota bacterium]
MNPKYGDIDPYWMAASAIDEVLRNIVAVGGDPQRTAILDNFCWGNTSNPEQLGALVRAALACYDIARIYETPFISGKDSLNNEYRLSAKKTISIPYSLLISGISVIEDVRKTISMDLKKSGNLIYIIGITRNELGGSHYLLLVPPRRDYSKLSRSEAEELLLAGNVPKVDAVSGRKIFLALSKAINSGLVKSCHDLSEGGLAVAAAEMAFAGDIGIEINLSAAPYEDKNTEHRTQDTEHIILFSESNTRFLVEIKNEHKMDFERTLTECPFALIGRTIRERKLKVFGLDGRKTIEEPLRALKDAWQKPLSRM